MSQNAQARQAFTSTEISSELLLQEIERARQEWVLAQNQLNYILEPDLIDHAIYVLDAAEKKYCYLLREARRLGVKADKINPLSLLR